MSGVNDGGPAFPYVQMSEATGQPINGCFNGGMSLRDWFAGQALAYWIKHQLENDCYQKNEPLAERWAYDTADKMLAEREKGGAE
jgi:hypothetical protein